MARTLPAAVSLAVLSLATGLLTAAPAQAATGTITGLAGKCLDVAAAGTADGTAVQLYDCNGTSAQQWSVESDGTIRALGKCLDVTGNSTADGAKAQLWTCTGGANQKWTVTAAHDIVNPQANKCLDVSDNNSANGTRIQIWSCGGGANQKWNAPGSGGTTPPAGSMAVAPYLYNGWGSPPNPSTITQATGVKWFTLAFVLSNGYCNPQWDGSRALTGGVDQQTVNTVRANGGDIIPSFGGYSGNKLESSCSSAGELAGAYQKVINAYGLKAIDIDIEADAYSNPTVQQRTVDALKTVKLTTQAAEGLKNALKTAYHYSDDQAYRDMGISSMNGITDNNETVTVNDFRTILAYAQQHHLARLTFWSANRDRPCTGGPADSCSGVAQSAWDYTRVFAGYTG
jgi:hypothetical protein